MGGYVLISVASAGAAVSAVFWGVLYFRTIRKLRRAARQVGRKLEAVEQALNETRKSEAGFRSLKGWYQALFSQTRSMVLVFSPTEDGLPGGFLDANEAAGAQLGYTRAQLSEMSIPDLEEHMTPALTSGYSRSDMVVLSDDYIRNRQAKMAVNQTRQWVKRAMEDGQAVEEHVFRARSGHLVPVEVELRRFDHDGRTFLVCTATDITERQQAEEELRKSRNVLNDFFTFSPTAVAVYDAERNLISANPACLRTFGVPDEDVFRQFNMFDNEFMPDAEKKRLQRGESVRFETTVDFSAMAGRVLSATVRTGERYLEFFISPMGSGSDLERRGFFAQIRDLTDRRTAEQELRERDARLLQAEKMEAIGSMAGGIAHDFNNILTPILGYAKMIYRKSPETDQRRLLASRIRDAGLRAKELAAQILTFARKADSGEDSLVHPIHILPVVKEVLKLQRASLPDDIRIERILRTERDVVVANPTKIHQIFMNLCTNAGHAMRDTGGGGLLEVVAVDFVVSRRTERGAGLPRGHYLQVTVRDTGAGIPAEIMDRIFDPLFTTKPKGEGTGMGLATVKTILKSCNGTIKVESEPGQGARFHVILPTIDTAVEPEAAGEAAERDGAAPPSGSECVLIVESDPGSLEAEQLMLEFLGYSVIPVAATTDALKRFRADPEGIDLIIAAQNMPALTGIGLAKKVHSDRGNLPVILCVNSEDEFSQDAVEAAGIGKVLSKPLELESLAQAVRRAIDQAPECSENEAGENKGSE